MTKMKTCALALGLATCLSVFAFNPQPDPPGYGMIGITPGQTLRLNVSNVPLASPETPPDPCRVVLTFVDAAGNELLPAVQKTLAPGKSTHLDFTPRAPTIVGDVTGAADSARVEIRPVIHILPNPTQGNPRAAAATRLIPPGPCVSSIEILDNRTGKTLVSSGPQKPGAIYEFNPQPDPPGRPLTFALTGIVPGQTARLNVVNVAEPGDSTTPPDPCRVTLAFVDEDGNIVAQGSEVLKAGQATLLDVSRAPGVDTTGDKNPGPTQLRGVVTIESLNPRQFAPPCRATVEVFDQATGQTTAILSPQHVPLRARSAE